MKWDNLMPFWRTRAAVSNIWKIILCLRFFILHATDDLFVHICLECFMGSEKSWYYRSNTSKLALKSKDKPDVHHSTTNRSKETIPYCDNYTIPLWQIGAWTKWSTFCARHHQMHFRVWKIDISNTIPLNCVIQETYKVTTILGGLYIFIYIYIHIHIYECRWYIIYIYTYMNDGDTSFIYIHIYEWRWYIICSVYSNCRIFNKGNTGIQISTHHS